MATNDLFRMDFDSVPEDMEADVIAAIQSRWPDWTPNDGNLEVWLIEAFARIASENGDMAAQVSMGVMKTYGDTIIGVPVESGVQAIANTTWTMIDDSGYTIPAGTKIGVLNSDGDLIAFSTQEDYTLPEGSTSTPDGDVFCRALDFGVDGNGLVGTAVLIDALNFVQSVVIDGTTSDGADPESDEDYLGRLTEKLQTIRAGAVIPHDFELLARDNAAVDRAVAIDGWNPVDDSIDNEKYIGIVVTDASGEDLDSTTKDDIQSYLDGLKELNFIVAIGSPEYTTIDVTAQISVFEGFDDDTVVAAVESALSDYLSPANWGRPSYGTDSRAWLNATKVRYLEIATVINNVTGVDAVTSLSVNGGTVDVDLTGTVPLTRAGTITITVP